MPSLAKLMYSIHKRNRKTVLYYTKYSKMARVLICYVRFLRFTAEILRSKQCEKKRFTFLDGYDII